MRRVLAGLVAAMLLAVAGGAEPTRTTPKAKPQAGLQAKARQKRAQNKPYQVGKASWYGRRFHGRTTASGEPFNMYQFTAAHRQLPLGTWVRVTNLKNGRWVVVRVNDRGPVPENRIIDLSLGVAQLLGFRDRGIARVRLDVVEPPATFAQVHNLSGLD
ncbi:MAG TPA: septal ring lytic transglycosylase RlpA family protein [Terriglobales bacterium]|nr:septal ring lytic transglycosylase RlpA family protein [Terriglobales bacterium]